MTKADIMSMTKEQAQEFLKKSQKTAQEPAILRHCFSCDMSGILTEGGRHKCCGKAWQPERRKGAVGCGG